MTPLPTTPLTYLLTFVQAARRRHGRCSQNPVGQRHERRAVVGGECPLLVWTASGQSSRRGTTATCHGERSVTDPATTQPDLTRPAGSTLGDVTIAEQPAEPGVKVYPPDEALRRAKPLPPRERFVIEDVPQDDWTAFREALAEA